MKNVLIIFATILGSLHANAEGGDARLEARLKGVLARRSAANAYSESLYAFAKEEMEENKLQLAISAAWVKKLTEQKKVVAEFKSQDNEKTEEIKNAEKLIDQWDSLVEGIEVRNEKIRELMRKGANPQPAILDLRKYNETCSQESKKIVEKFKSSGMPSGAVVDATQIEAEWGLLEKTEQTRLEKSHQAEIFARKKAEAEREQEAKDAELVRWYEARIAKKAEEELDVNGLVYMRKTVKSSIGEFGGEITGIVENRRGKDLRYVEITFSLYDDSGAQVGTAFANVTGLDAGGRWKFRAIILRTDATKFKVFELSGF